MENLFWYICVLYTRIYSYIYVLTNMHVYICMYRNVYAHSGCRFSLSLSFSLSSWFSFFLFLPDALSLSLSFSLSLALSPTLPLPLSLSLASASTVRMSVSLSKWNARQCEIAGIPILACLCIIYTCMLINICIYKYARVYMYVRYMYTYICPHMGWLRLVGSLKL